MRGRAGTRGVPARPALAGRRTTRTAAGVWMGGVSQEAYNQDDSGRDHLELGRLPPGHDQSRTISAKANSVRSDTWSAATAA